jgi:hypothetical protein
MHVDGFLVPSCGNTSERTGDLTQQGALRREQDTPSEIYLAVAHGASGGRAGTM